MVGNTLVLRVALVECFEVSVVRTVVSVGRIGIGIGTVASCLAKIFSFLCRVVKNKRATNVICAAVRHFSFRGKLNVRLA